MAKKPAQFSEEQMVLYRKLIATHPEITMRGVTMPYTSLIGHMFTFLSGSGVGIRLPEQEREEFLKKYNATLYQTQGTVLKEYVTVPGTLLKKTKELKQYLDVSHQYTRTLKPKPGGKKS
ncbi:MAG TPA: hypothetical protein PLD84_08260 [Chitinophagales bacterium]|nr:hypothetical protein [Chitinophagales bacterium]